MSTLSLMGLLPEFGKLTPVGAERWVASSLAHAAALREYDAWLYPADPDHLPSAERLHDAWRSWAEDAQAVLSEAESVAATGSRVPHLDSLRDSLGETRAMLRMTPSLILQRHAQVRRGEVFSLEEVAMNYGLTVAGDARADFRMIDIWLQEEVWDELELLAANPSLLTLSAPERGAVHKFSRILGTMIYYTAITLTRNEATKMLTVLGISVDHIALPPKS